MKKKILIVDDDPIVTATLTQLIGFYPNLELVGNCASFEEAKIFFSKELADIVLLDMELSDGLGFNLIPFISGNPSIIVITGNEHYAFTAFEIGAIDFLKKPILPNRFKKSIDKIFERSASADNAPAFEKEHPYLFIKSGVKIIKIEIDQLIYAEALRDYIKLVLVKNESYLVNLSLTELAKRLAPYGFIQVHRSYMVAMRHIKQVQDDLIYLAETKTPVPVGKTYKQVIGNLLQ